MVVILRLCLTLFPPEYSFLYLSCERILLFIPNGEQSVHHQIFLRYVWTIRILRVF